MRYYANGAGGHFNHHVLLDDQTILEIIRRSASADLFCSVQKYDSDGIERESQLVFDIDNNSFADAYEIARQIEDEVMYKYDTDVSVWFSGSKGFHVITGLTATGQKANRGMKSIAESISSEIDPSMYKSRSLFRLPNSINSKSGLRKIEVRHNETIASILSRAEHTQPYTSLALEYNNDTFNSEHSKSVELLDLITHTEVDINTADWLETLVPCVKSLLDNGVPEGSRYATCFYLVRHWRLCGMSVDDAIATASTMPVFQAAGYTDGMIYHYYSGMVRTIGCRSGELSSVMQDNCVSHCRFSKEYSDAVTRAITSSVW